MKQCRLLTLALFLLFLAVSTSFAAEKAPFSPTDTLEEIRAKIEANGYNFTVDENWVTRLPEEERSRLFTRRYSPKPPADVLAKQYKPLPRREALPASFDWRNYNGKSFIGPVRNQGSCGSCYAFGAAAAAEGTYNKANNLYDSNVADFSEGYVAWCLGKYGPYSDHFSGCDGADYEYQELYALTQEGITTEAAYPYSGTDPGSCNAGSYQTVVFDSWGRAESSNIDDIKNAIMTHGVIDAAVYVTSAFQAYSGGVYEDSLNACNGQGAWVPTNHAIALVGWDDNGDAENNGYWILRNSWGTGWGENGYMRIKYDSARVSCAPAYLTLSGSSTEGGGAVLYLGGKYYVLPGGSGSGPTPPPPASGFDEQFTSSMSNWTQYNGSWSIVNGAAHVEGTDTDNWLSIGYNQADFSTLDYSAMIQNTQGIGTTALVVRGTPEPLASDYDWSSYYMFGYSNDGTYIIGVWNSGSWTSDGWFNSSAINTYDWNTLRVTASGSALNFYINGTLVDTLTDASLSTGEVGIAIQDYGPPTVNVDYATLNTTVSSNEVDFKAPERIPALKGNSKSGIK